MEILTGKAKEQFEEWYHNNQANQYLSIIDFKKCPMSIRSGVYFKFADTKNIKIEVFNDSISTLSPYWVALIDDKHVYKGYRSSRPEAQTAALKKLNELINEKD